VRYKRDSGDIQPIDIDNIFYFHFFFRALSQAYAQQEVDVFG
jgi:hypothetical protein